MIDVEAPIARLIEAYRKAVFDKDVNGFMRLYRQQARVFDAWGVWSYKGADAWRETIDEWFSSLDAERVAVKFEDVQIVPGQSLSAVSAIVTYAACSADGQPLRAMQNRLTWLLERDGSRWKIVHEHTSAPVDLNHSKAILHRENAH